MRKGRRFSGIDSCSAQQTCLKGVEGKRLEKGRSCISISGGRFDIIPYLQL